MTDNTIHHEPYENDDNREQCLECGQPIPSDQVYCEPCFERLENLLRQRISHEPS